jgi:flagellin-like protein
MKVRTKKGISPLIATVLLVAISVAMGAMVMTFTERTTTEISGDTEKKVNREIKCSLDMSINLVQLDGEDYICYNRTNSENLEFIIENQGSETIEGVQVFLLDANEDPFTFNVLEELSGHNRAKYNLSINETVFPPTQILLAPILSGGATNVDVCSNNRIEIEEVEQCT